MIEDFKIGDIVEVKHWPGCLWKIEKLGDASFYDSGALLSDSPSDLALYQPPPEVPWEAIDRTWLAFRNEMHVVSPLIVLARMSERGESAAANLLRKQKYKRRQKEVMSLKKKAAFGQLAGQLAREELERSLSENPCRSHPVYDDDDEYAWSVGG